MLLAQSIEKIALYLVTVAVISHIDNLAYKSAGNFEFKTFITKLSQSKGSLLKVQQTTSTQARNIVKGNHTKPQPVEKLPPLKKEINIPTYIHVTF